MVEKRSEIAHVATWMNFVFQSALKWVTERTAQPSVAVVRTGKSKCLLAQAEPYGNPSLKLGDQTTRPRCQTSQVTLLK